MTSLRTYLQRPLLSAPLAFKTNNSFVVREDKKGNKVDMKGCKRQNVAPPADRKETLVFN